MIVEVDGEWYISVKGTAKAYEVKINTIQYQLNNNLKIFENHVFMTRTFQ